MTSRDGSPFCWASNASDLHSEVDPLDSIYCGPRFGFRSFIDDQRVRSAFSLACIQANEMNQPKSIDRGGAESQEDAGRG